ncbi:hypothetical protein A2U01_0079293, partial [Trifolium medium]|nr:hypothetical protein [Trifolium medium]
EESAYSGTCAARRVVCLGWLIPGSCAPLRYVLRRAQNTVHRLTF